MSAWTSAGLQPTTGYYPYDPTLAAYGWVIKIKIYFNYLFHDLFTTGNIMVLPDVINHI